MRFGSDCVKFLCENAGSMKSLHKDLILWCLGLPIDTTPESLTWDPSEALTVKRARYFFRNIHTSHAIAASDIFSIRITNLLSISKVADYQLAPFSGLDMNSSVVCFNSRGFNIHLRVCSTTMLSLTGKPISGLCVISRSRPRYLSYHGNVFCPPCGLVVVVRLWSHVHLGDSVEMNG